MAVATDHRIPAREKLRRMTPAEITTVGYRGSIELTILMSLAYLIFAGYISRSKAGTGGSLASVVGVSGLIVEAALLLLMLLAVWRPGVRAIAGAGYAVACMFVPYFVHSPDSIFMFGIAFPSLGIMLAAPVVSRHRERKNLGKS